MAKKEKEQKPKKTIKEIMDAIIDKDALAKRKSASEIKNKEDVKETIVEKPKQWYDLPLDRNKFFIIAYKDKLYLRYDDWNPTVFTGPYNSKDDCQKVIEQYMENETKNKMDRKLVNVHSIILHIDE